MASARKHLRKFKDLALSLLLAWALAGSMLFPLNSAIRTAWADDGEGTGDETSAVTYTLTYTVAGDGTYGTPADAATPPAAEGIEEGTSYTLAAVPATTWSTSDGTASGKAGSWAFAGWSLTQGGSAVTTVTVDTDTQVYGTWTFTPASDPDPDPDPDPDTPTPKLAIAFKATNKGSGTGGAFTSGQTANFDVTVENRGNAAAEGIILETTLDGMVFEEDSARNPRWVLLDDDGNQLAPTAKRNGTAKRILIPSLAAGAQLKEIPAHYKVTAADVSACKATFTLKAKCNSDAYTFVSDEATIPAGSKDAAPDTPSAPYIAQFQIGWGDPSFLAGLSTTPTFIVERGETRDLGIILTWNDYRSTLLDDTFTNVEWSSSDEDIATVDAKGHVVPKGKNGKVTITARGTSTRSDLRDCAFTATLEIAVYNQEEKATLKVFYQGGEEIPLSGDNSTIIFKKRGNEYRKMVYATIEVGGKTYSSKDNNAKDDVEFNFTVESLDVADAYYPGSGTAYVWPTDDGRKYATQLFVAATVKGSLYVRMVPITVDGDIDYGKSGGIVPSGLTIKVKWERDPNPADPATREQTFSLAELDQLSTIRQAYTIIGNPESDRKPYGYQTARGVYLSTLFDMCEIYEEDVSAIEVKATDAVSVTTSFMPVAHFFSTPRYYYPNYYLGGNTSVAVAAPAMIAVASNIYWGTWDDDSIPITKATRVDNLYSAAANLDAPDGAQPRLCIGALGSLSTGGRYSVSNVETITVVLKGAPPDDLTHDDDDDDEDEKKQQCSENTTFEEDSECFCKHHPEDARCSGAPGPADGEDPGNGGKGQSGTGNTPSTTGIGTSGSDDSGLAVNDGNNAGATDTSETRSASEGAAGGGGEALARSVSTSYSIYEMMSTAQTDAPITAVKNPYLDYLIYLIDIIILAGASRFAVWYALQKRTPQPRMQAAV